MPRQTEHRSTAVDRLSDAARWAIIAAAVMLPLTKRRGRSAAAAGASILGGTVGSQVLKSAVDRVRPDGRNARSFPSEHAAESAAAAYVLRKAGHRFWPTAAAALVGFGRLRSGEHHIGDVLAGAVLGILSGRLGRVTIAEESRRD